MKDNLLYLVHRIPYPPNKGDKIRSFNILRWLSKRYQVYLGCFIDDPDDRSYESMLDEYCIEKKCISLNPPIAKIKSLTALVSGEPVTLPYYRNPALQTWIHQTMKHHDIKKVLVFSSSMAQYIESDIYKNIKRVIDFVDVDSDKWRQYAQKSTFPWSWIYHREYKLLESYEIGLMDKFNKACFVSKDEAELFKQICKGRGSEKITSIDNGVDAGYFSPDALTETPVSGTIKTSNPKVIFTGAMDYWANEDAVVWFATHVWPHVITKIPKAEFYIVGGNPGSEVNKLANIKSIKVTGRVEDVRPYIAAADIIVAPLQIARGIQNKVLEALAMAKPVVATSMAMEGIDYRHYENSNNEKLAITICDEPDAYTAAVIAGLSVSAQALQNRDFVLNQYDWVARLAALDSALE